MNPTETTIDDSAAPTPDAEIAHAKALDDAGSGTEQAEISLPEAVEAVLVTAERALPPLAISTSIGPLLGSIESAEIEGAIDQLNAAYDATGRCFRIERVAGGYRMMTRPLCAPVLAAVEQQRKSGKLSKAALESLAIVAYKQPITRARLEAIRGVACGEVLRSLLDRRLIAIKGRAEELGRPMLYGTSKSFLQAFGLGSIKDLPSVGDLTAPEVEQDTEPDDSHAHGQSGPDTPSVYTAQDRASEPATGPGAVAE